MSGNDQPAFGNFGQDGRWCIGNSCSKKIGGENPIGAILEQFEAGFLRCFSWNPTGTRMEYGYESIPIDTFLVG